jgi:hypothetical protein
MKICGAFERAVRSSVKNVSLNTVFAEGGHVNVLAECASPTGIVKCLFISAVGISTG